jgi:iron complex transport system substrate-binding protein
MNNLNKKIVTLIPSATEIVAFLGKKDLIVGRSHECDFPKDLKNIVKLTSPKINVEGTSGEIDKQINVILENSLSVYKVDVEKLKKLDPDFIVTQSHCEVCAVSFSEVENIVREHLNQKTKIISLQPNTLNEVLDDIRRVASDLEINKEKSELLIGNLEKRLESIRDKAKNKKKPKVACVEWLDPLMIAGNWIPEMVSISGGNDVFGKAGNDSHWVKFEEIKKQDPDIIIFMPCGFDIIKTNSELENLLKKNIEWHSLKAFKDGNLFVVDGNQFFNRPGPRLIESIEILAEIIHPDIFEFNHENTGWIEYKQ